MANAANNNGNIIMYSSRYFEDGVKMDTTVLNDETIESVIDSIRYRCDSKKIATVVDMPHHTIELYPFKADNGCKMIELKFKYAKFVATDIKSLMNDLEKNEQF